MSPALSLVPTHSSSPSKAALAERVFGPGKPCSLDRVTLSLRICAAGTYLRSLFRLVAYGGGRCSRVFRDARPAAVGQELLSLSLHRSPRWIRSNFSRKRSQWPKLMSDGHA